MDGKFRPWILINILKNAIKNYGLEVHFRDLDVADFSGSKFHAITMNYVIEKVFDSIKLIKKCINLLNHNGYY